MARETQSGGFGSSGGGQPTAGVGSANQGVFRKEGEYWTVGFGGNAFRLKNTKGLGYLAHLLRHPAVEFHVLDLAGGIATHPEEEETGQSATDLPRRDEDLEKAGIHVASLGDAGEMLDEQAKVAYRRRLADLREELEKAKERGSVERGEQIEQEIDALTRELSRAVGLGGRNRRAGSASERARQSITKSIKSVLERIAQTDEALGDIFTRCIRTGIFCSYQPDPVSPIAWEFAATDAGSTIEPPEPPNSTTDPALERDEIRRVLPRVLEVSPFSMAERTAFVGRKSEGSAICAMIDRALKGQGSIVMLWDGPGVGKTRLAMQMTDYASRNGFRCSVGHCYERDEPFPYLPFAEIIESNLAQASSVDDYRAQMGPYAAEMAQIAPSLRRVFPDLPKRLELPAAQQRGYLFQSFAEVIAKAARTRPNIYLLEDLHWADESTLALLTYLSRRIAQLPAVIIGTYRSGYSHTNQALVRTLEELIRIGVRPQKLGGLSKDAVAEMLHELSQREVPEGLVNLIFEESQGYPFFVEEVYRHLIEEGKVFDAAGQFRTDLDLDETDVPENVRLIIGRRLGRLDESEKRALAAAAVIGRSFSFQLLTAISQIDVDELFSVIDKAQQMGIIISSSEGPERPFTFRHELVRQTLLAEISAPRRQQLHARVADAIERLYPDAVKERAGEIADHLLKAKSFAQAQTLIRYLTLAGRSALDAAAFEEAQQNFESALSLQGAVPSTERADLLANLAMALRGLERRDGTIANLREALEIYVKLGDQVKIGRAFNELTDAFFWAGHFTESAETARRGLTYLQDGVSAYRAGLLAALGLALAAFSGFEPVDRALKEAMDIASRLSNPKLMANVHLARSMINVQFFRFREVAQDVAQGGFVTEKPGESEAPSWERALHLLGPYEKSLYLGHLEEAARIVDQLEPLARKIGQSYMVVLCIITKAWVDFGKAPELAKLEAAFEQVSGYDQKSPVAFWEVLSEVQASFVDFFRGSWPAALSHAQASRRAEVGSSLEGLGVGTLLRQMAYAGDRYGAFAILDEKREWLPIGGRTNARGSWFLLAQMIEGLFMLGEKSQAAQLYPLAYELIGTGTVALWPIFRLAHTIAGIAAAAGRQWKAAEDHFSIAMQQAEALPNLLEQAEIRRFHAMMLMDRAARGDREKAQTLLSEALKTYADIGMPRHIELTRTLLDGPAGG